MQSRSSGCWRTPLLVLTAALLALAPLVTFATENRTVLRTPTPATDENGPHTGPVFAPSEVPQLRKPTLFPRTNTFWTYSSGPSYGFIPPELGSSPDVLYFGVGSFVTSGPGLAFPNELRAPEVPTGPAYYIVQFRQSAFTGAEVENSLKAIAATGATLVEYVAHNGYIVKVDPASFPAVASSRTLQFISPYHPAYKIAPDLGTAPLPDPDKAASTVYSLRIVGFRGMTAADLSARVTSLGGKVSLAEDNADGAFILADLDMSKVVSLAKVEGVKYIDENLPRFAMGEENSWDVIAGTYIVALQPTLYQAGVDGSGRYLKDVDVAPTSAASPPVVGTGDTDWNGNGILDNAAQVIADTDTGMSVDGGDFSETSTTTGFSGSPTNAGPNVGVFPGLMHRKIAWYEAAPGGFGTGDTNSCDPGQSHGTVTSAQAAGNASSGPFTADGLDWNGDGTVDNYGTPFTFVSGGTSYRVDGVARGARILFQDVNNTCPEPSSFSFGSYTTLLGDARAKGARIHTYSFGAFSKATGSIYDGSAQQIDAFLATDANRDYMMFVAAGNNGTGSVNSGGQGKAKSLSNEATAKNVVAVGADFSGSTAALNTRVSFSSVGPAPNGQTCSNQSFLRPWAASNCGRIKPDLMAPGSDGNLGLAESYNCRTSDQNQNAPVECAQETNGAGTSFSTPNAAGAGALVRDYFAQGLYPDGTSGNPSNSGDRKPHMSGALVKALLIASAQDVTGGGNPAYGHRFNPEVGYGFVDLKAVLPLANDPTTPTGLIVFDGACPTGVTDCPSNLSLSSPLGASTSSLATFNVVDANQPLRVVLSWIDPQSNTTGALVDDLNLELRYCGADGNCTTNTGDTTYYGNCFTEDVNDDGTEDQDLDGTAGMNTCTTPGCGHTKSEGSWSLANRGDPPAFTVACQRDTRNNNEAIYLSNDPENDGTTTGHTADNQLKTGLWQVTVAHTATGTDQVKYAVVISGGVTLDSSIRLDTSPISCNSDIAVIVNEVAKATTTDPACNTTACTPATIQSRTKIVVKDTTGTQVDFDNTLTFTQDPSSLKFTSKRFPVSTAAAPNTDDDILLAGDAYTITASYTDQDCNIDGTANCQNTPAENVVKVSSVTYNCSPNVQFFAIGQPGRNAPFLLAGGCDSDKYLDNGEQFTYMIQFGNLEDTLDLTDVTVTLRAVVPDGDNTTDPGRLNNSPSPYVTVSGSPQSIPIVFAGFLETAAFTVTVANVPAWPAAPALPPEVEMVVGVSSQKAGKSAATYTAFKHILNGDDQGFLYSTDYPSGATVDRDINANEKIENPIHDRYNRFPNGTATSTDGLNETITFSDMTTTAFGGGNPGFNGPWDFDTDDEGFRSGLYALSSGNVSETTEWGEDHDYDGSLSGPLICHASPGTSCTCGVGLIRCNDAAHCGAGDPLCMTTEDFDGDQDGTIDEGWNTKGGCGYLTSNGTNRGIWHTGQIGPVGQATCESDTFPANPASTPPSCENFDTIPGTAGQNFWLEFLRTPVINKVHVTPDNRNLSYRVELKDWRWNTNADFQPDLQNYFWEFDEDTANLDPVDLSDGFVLGLDNDGMGPFAGGNVNLTTGFPMFVANDPDDNTAPFGQANGSQGRNRAGDRGCFFQTLTGVNASWLLRTPTPNDDDCDNDIVSLGADGCPGKCGVDDDGDGVVDNRSEACPCYQKPDGVDDDADGRTDEQDELQRFYRCQGTPTLYCGFPGADSTVTGGATHSCNSGGGSGTCGRFGDGKPKPYGDDVCGDGSIDEGVSDKWATETALGENGHRIAQNQNWNIGSVGGPFLRFQTLEDFYDVEAGNTFQGALGFGVFEGTTSAIPHGSYGVGIDDMTVEWQESHPVEQAAGDGCGNKTCTGGPRAGLLCFNTDDCGAGGTCSAGASGNGVSSCAALTWGTTNLYQGSGVVSLTLQDFNAETTQGGFDCTKYGFVSGCGGGNCSNSNDCDNDGFKEVEVALITPGEPNGESARLEQTSLHSATYTANIQFSSSINAPNDGIVFLQFNGQAFPQVRAQYFDKDAGAGDFNGDGTPDSPPNNGKDGCPGFCNVDDNNNASGPDKRPGVAFVDDDGNGICDYKSANAGAGCTTNANCTGGSCLNVDEPDELCGRLCSGGTSNGFNCTSNADCPGGGTCGSVVQRGDDNCANIDEPGEQCPIVAGKLVAGVDDNCGCATNPILATLNTVFNTADIVVQGYTLTDNGDNDGFADDNELVTVSLTLRNLAGFDVDNVQARLTTQSPLIQCLNDATAKFGRINQTQSATNLDPLQFTVGTVGRTALLDVKQAQFTVTVTGTALLADGSKIPIEGTATPQNFTVDLDLDVSSALPASTKATKSFSFDSNQYANLAAWNSDWFHTFFNDQAGIHCQYNDPGNPNSSAAPVGCFLRQDPGTSVTSDDWHLHSNVSGTGTANDGGRDSGNSFCSNATTTPCDVNADCPSGGTCTATPGAGKGAMHMGFHDPNFPGNVAGDTIHLDNMFYTYFKGTTTQGTPGGNLQVGLGRPGTDDPPSVSFWEQVSITDNRMFSNLSPPFSGDAAVVHVLVDRNNDGTQQIGDPSNSTKDGWWEKVLPYYGTPTQQRFPFGNCTYDPNDDGNNEKDIAEQLTINGRPQGPSSTCFPEFIWACVGDTQDPPYTASSGQVAPGTVCFPEVDSAGNPVVRQGNGPGRWVQAKIDLYRYRGRKIWMRFFNTHIQFGVDTWNTGFGGTFGGNRDDGWYIDDLIFHGMSASAITLKADTKVPPASSCPASNCTSVVPHLYATDFVVQHDGIDNNGDGTIDEINEEATGSIASDAPLRNISLDGASATNPTTSNCINGVLQYRFWVDTNGNGTFDAGSDNLIRDFQESPFAVEPALCGETVRMDARCSSLTTCTAQTTLAVSVPGATGPTPVTGVLFSDVNHFTWNNVAGVTFDTASRRISTNTFDGAFGSFVCRGNQSSNTKDITAQGTPPAGNTDLWLVRARNTCGKGSWNETGETADRDSQMTTICP